MEADLKAALQESLDLYIFPNAIFLAERLLAQVPSAENLYLLAKAHFDSGDASTCFLMLKSYFPFDVPRLVPCQDDAYFVNKLHYLFGVACARCNRYSECEQVFGLLTTGTDDGAAEYWLGVCAQRLGKPAAKSSEMFEKSVRKNPNLFVSYEALVKNNAQCAAVNLYQEIESFDAETAGNDSHRPQSFADARQQRSNTPPPPAQALRGNHVPPPPPSLSRNSSTHSVGGTLKPPGGAVPSVPRSRPNNLQSRVSCSTSLIGLFSCFADVLVSFYSYDCAATQQLLQYQHFPEHDSGWTLSHLALSYFHDGCTAESVGVFSRMREVEPWRLQDRSLVYFSTALWHLRDEYRLGLLSQQLIEDFPMSAVTLCVAGNCYSLVKDSKMGLQMFSRAVLVDRTFSYAHTLYGYELLAADQKAEAEVEFAEALRWDGRHYLAHAGLGEIAYRKDNASKAQQYFQAAVSINRHPTIMNRLAGTFHHRGASVESLRKAMDIYDLTLSKNPTNVGARHQRAEVLMKLGRNEEALLELEKLKAGCPDEAMLYISLGRCCHRLQRTQLANQYFHKALDLDPRRNAFIKSCLERLQNNVADDGDY